MSRIEKTNRFQKIWDKYKYVALVVVLGVVLLLWPKGTRINQSDSAETKVMTADYSSDPAQVRTEMESILSKIKGVGQLQLMLTVESDGERQLAQDTELSYSGETTAPNDYTRKTETILLDDSGEDKTVVTQTRWPTWRGALVVCEGGDQADVKLEVTQAVAALTGLSSDRITVAKWQ